MITLRYKKDIPFITFGNCAWFNCKIDGTCFNWLIKKYFNKCYLQNKNSVSIAIVLEKFYGDSGCERLFID